MKQEHGGNIYAYENRNIIDFSANINPFRRPKEIDEAIALAIQDIGNYPDIACRKLKIELEEYHREYGVSAKEIICGNGAAELIHTFVHTLKPRRVLVCKPSFGEYEKALFANGCEVISYYTKRENEFALDNGYLDVLKTSQVDMIMLCSPANPVGSIISGVLMKDILEYCNGEHISVLLDESFMEFVIGEEGVSQLTNYKRYPNLFILRSFTKMFSLAGVRLGYGIASNCEMIHAMEGMRQSWSVSHLAQIAGIVACNQKAFALESKMKLTVLRKDLQKQLEDIGCKVFPSSANFLLFLAKEGLAEKLLTANILIRDCSSYDGLEAGYYRVAVRDEEDNQKLVEGLKNAAK